jgi:predicted GH43/DUF377 family glycosyl hydrolase
VTAAPIIEVRRTPVRLRPDPHRVAARLFLPGQEGPIEGGARAGSIVHRVMDLDDDQAAATLDEVLRLFSDRHDDLPAVLDEHFALVAHRLRDPASVPAVRRRLIGAYFTQEYALEAAAVCNPSMVAHPDQTGVGPGSLRFVMSLRAVGEGHISAIEFRTGTVAADGTVRLQAPGNHLAAATPTATVYRRDLFGRLLRAMADSTSSASFVLGTLPETFSRDELDRAIGHLQDQILTRPEAVQTIDRMRRIAAGSYALAFPATSSISERYLFPTAPDESNGMEDARFVRFVDDDGHARYHGVYTAFDGSHIAPRLLTTDDFLAFTSRPLAGRAATNKGMALFPRRIDGRYVALSRWDQLTNSVVTSDDLNVWDDPVSLQRPGEPWDLVQLGNCGSPLETGAGWIVLTHGVGPMRRYVIGADLLALDDPTRVIGKLTRPLLVPSEEERDGYVPNVVYSCGALLHAGRVTIPYGMADANIGVASVDVDELVAGLLASS